MRSLIPPARRTGTAVNRAADEGGDDEAPPSYEQAAQEPAYVPAAEQSSGIVGSGSGAGSAPAASSEAARPSSMLSPGGQGSTTSAYPGNGGGRVAGMPLPGRGQMRPGLGPMGAGPGRERECVVM